MNGTADFIKYSIINASKINKIIKTNQPLPGIVARFAGLKKSTPGNISPALEKRVANIAFFLSILFPGLRKRRCLFSSLLIMRWAYSRGLDPKLNIGLREKTGQMEGHAWLSINGSTFCERSTLAENYRIKLSETKNLIYWYNEE